MATTTQIAEKAAEKLGILAIEGETLRSDYSADLDASYVEIHAELQTLGLVSWSNTDTIPDEYVSSIAALVAENRASTYQIPDARYIRLKMEGKGENLDGKAMKMIRKLQAVDKMGVTQIENY